MDAKIPPAVDETGSWSSNPSVDGQPDGPAGAGTTGPSLCLWCEAPLPPPARRTLHPKQYCNAACRGQAHQYLRAEEIRETVSTLAATAERLYQSYLDVCGLINEARVRLQRFTLSARERRHHAGSFPPASGRSPADILRARRTLLRVLDDVPAQGGPRLCGADLHEADGYRAGESRGDPGRLGIVATTMDGPWDGSAVHPPCVDVVAPAELGGRDRDGDRGVQRRDTHATRCVQRDGVGQ